MRRSVSFIFLLISVCFFTSCKKEETIRTYTEIYVEAPPKVNPQDGNDPIPESMGVPPAGLIWTAPSGWAEKPGRGMRMATLFPDPIDTSTECTIVSMGAEAGTLEANVIRWLGQLAIPVPDGAGLKSFLDAQTKFQTKDSRPGLMIDFFSLMKDPSKNMIASMISYQNQTVFVKLTGTPEKTRVYKSAFLELCQSLKKE